ncbi:MAG: hypothetical protein H0V82_01610 [Candidatus Protochlamydia sp.]|nr:hypothetical protein [Candidatus Protochlamydia sp.]
MEIKNASQSLFYSVEQTNVKNTQNDSLKGISTTLNYLNQLKGSKLENEKNFFKISPKQDIYAIDCRSIAKDINDLNVPLCDTIGGG